MKKKEKNWLQQITEKKKIEKNEKETTLKKSIGKKVDSLKKKDNQERKSGKKLTKTMKLDKEKMTPRKKNKTIEVMFERQEMIKKDKKESTIKEIISKFESCGARMDANNIESIKKQTDNEKIKERKETVKLGSTTREFEVGIRKN